MSEASPPQMGGSRVSVGVPGQMNLYSGAVLVLLGLIALVISFFHPGPVGDYVQPEAFEPSPVSSAERATKDDAVAMVKKAVAAIKASVDKVAPDKAAIDKAAADKTAIDKAAADKAAADKAAIDKTAIDKAYADITAKGGPFTDRDIYIVVYKTDGVVLAHAQNERLVGTNQKEAKDPDENAFVAKRIELAKKNQPFWHYYKFVDPLTQKTERNQMYCEPLNDTIVCGEVGAVAPGLYAYFLSIFLFVMGNFGPVMMPRMLAILVGLAGGAIAVGLLPIRNQQDFYGGVALIGLAVVAMLASIDLPGMRGFAFGPGTAPRLFATLLAVLAVVLAAGGLLFEGPSIERYAFRGPIFLTASVLIFAATIRPLGLVLSSFATIIASAVATPDVKWRDTLIWAEILTAFCAFLFPYALNLPFQLWPSWWQQEFWLRPLWVAIAIMIATVIYFVRTHERTDRGERHV